MSGAVMFARVDEAAERGRVRPLLVRDDSRRIVKPKRDRLGTRIREQQFSRGRQFAGGIGGAGVDVGNATDPGVRPDVVGTYMLEYSHLEQRLGQFAFKTVTSDSREELFAYPLSAPYPRRQDRGTAPVAEGTDYVQFRLRHYAWALRVGIHVDDIDDDRTGSAMQILAQGARNFATLPERVFMQIIQGATDAVLLPTIPNAPDGAAMYATTAGGSNRFGVSSGNLLTGTASPSALDLREQLFEVTAQMRQFTDTKGQPLFDPRIIDDEGITIVYGPSIEREMREAHFQALTIQTSGTVGTDLAAAAVSNIIMESGLKITLYNSPRITDSSCYYFLNSSKVERPIMHSVRRDLYTVVANEDTSDWGRDTNQLFEQSRVRHGYRPLLPLSTVKVDNS